MARPILKIKPSPLDYMIELVALAGVAALIILPVMYYGDLPDQIPLHYDASGEPDKFGNKSSIWFLPIVGLVLYLFISWIGKKPHLFNFPVPVTPENAPRLYLIATRILSIMKAIAMVTLAYIIYVSIQIGFGNNQELGKWFLPATLVSVSGMLLYALYMTRQSKEMRSTRR